MIIVMNFLFFFMDGINGERKKTYTVTIEELPDTKFQGVYNDSLYTMTNMTISSYLELITNSNEEQDEEILSEYLSFIEVDLQKGKQKKNKIKSEDIKKVKSNSASDKQSNGEIDEDNNESDEDDGDDDEDDESNNNNNKRRNLLSLTVDDRIQITSSYYFPYRAVGMIRFQDKSGSWHTCSGVLIGPQDVLTAGHCVHSGGSTGDWYSNFYFYPGKVSSSSSSIYSGTTVHSVVGWVTNADWTYDYGLIKLSSAPNVGWFSFGYNTAIDSTWFLYGLGYPSDKNFGTMWKTDGYVSEAQERYLIDSSCTLTGMDGTGMYKSGYIVYGIYSRSGDRWVGSCSGSVCSGYWIWSNYHTRITSTRFELLCDWIDNTDVC